MQHSEYAKQIFDRAWFNRVAGISPSPQSSKQWDETKYERQGKGSDKGGEFAPKGGGSVAFVAPAIDDPSGSIDRDTTKAIRQLDGERHANQKRIMEDVDSQLGIKSTHVNAVGVWSDGAENSLTIQVEGVDHETLKYATAFKAQIARQKDAIAFTPDEDGNSYLYTVSVKDKDISSLRKSATDSGLQYHTIHEDGKNGSKVIVFDPSGSGELDDAVDDFYDKVNAYDAKRTRGQGEFLTNEYNSRSKASAKYDAIIDDYEKNFPDQRHYQGRSGEEYRHNRRRSESTKGLTRGQAEVASALFQRVWDETKIKRQGKGSDSGGEFAPKEGGDAGSDKPSHSPIRGQQEIPFPERQGRLPFAGVKPGREAGVGLEPNPLAGRRPEPEAKPAAKEKTPAKKTTAPVAPVAKPAATAKPAKPMTNSTDIADISGPQPPKQPSTKISRPETGPNSKAAVGLTERIIDQRARLPQGFEVREGRVHLPNGQNYELPRDSQARLDMIHEHLTRWGHDPATVQAGDTSIATATQNRPVSQAAATETSVSEDTTQTSRDAENSLKEITNHLPDGFRVSATGNSLVFPDGTLKEFPTDSAEAVKMIEGALRDHGHDPKTVVQTSQFKAQLKSIGADFLDDVEPDKDGNLIQKRQSNASYSVEGSAPQDWHDVDSYTQNHVEERWREDHRVQLENDSDFHSELRSEAEESADAQIDSMNNSDIAAEIAEEIKGMSEFEGATTEEVEAMLDEGNETILEVRDNFIVNKRDELIDEKMEGDWYSDRLSSRADDDENDMGSDDWYRYAEENDHLSDEDSGNEDVNNKLSELGLDIEDLTTMMGAPDDWDFQVTYDSEHDGVECTYSGGGNIMTRVFYQNEDGDLAVYNSHFKLNDRQPKGLGLEIFSQAVAACKEQGVVEFKTHAAGSWQNVGPGDYVGFAVWPTFGYTFPVNALNSNTQEKIADAYPDAEDVQDIFDEPGGSKWWWKNGSSLYGTNQDTRDTEYATFNLREGSRSLKVLQRYMSGKKSARDAIHEKIAK